MKGQGIANFFTGFLGGMGGCAMIGQSVINVKSGGETRLSTFVSGVFLLFLLLVLGPLVAIIPMASLVSVMLMVSIGPFSSRPIRDQHGRTSCKTGCVLTFKYVVPHQHEQKKKIYT